MTQNGNGKHTLRSATLDEDLEAVQRRQRAIGRRLRGLFDDIVAEGVPDEFDELLERLEESEERKLQPGDVQSPGKLGPPRICEP